MIFGYYLYSINTYNYSYKYKVKVDNDIFEYDIDLIKEYPNYNFITDNYANNRWYYYVNKSRNQILGNIEQFDINNYKKYSYPRNIINNKTEYKIAEQYQLDKYYYLINEKNDNSKLYETLYNYLINYYKRKILKKKKKKN